MLRRIVVSQEKGGASKSTLVRALAEFDPTGWVLEIEAHRRLIELGSRVQHCPVRPERREGRTMLRGNIVVQDKGGASKEELVRAIADIDLAAPALALTGLSTVQRDTAVTIEGRLREACQRDVLARLSNDSRADDAL